MGNTKDQFPGREWRGNLHTQVTHGDEGGGGVRAGAGVGVGEEGVGVGAVLVSIQ